MSQKIFSIKNDWQPVASVLTSFFSLPQLKADMAIYATSNEGYIFEINFKNNECYFRSYNKNKKSDFRYLEQSNSTSPIKFENKGVKFILKIFYQLGLHKALVNEITRLDYSDKKEVCASIQIGTMLGDLLVIKESSYAELESLLRPYLNQSINKDDIDNIIKERGYSAEPIFSDIGTLNRKIQDFSDRFSLDVSSVMQTISSQMASKSNDYGFYNSFINKLAGVDLEQSAPSESDVRLFKPLSIVIASFNSDSTILKTLRSIQSQSLSKEQKSLLDVVIIDDGSNNRVAQIIGPCLKELDFVPTIIRFEKNRGLSLARNAGFHMSKYDHVLFMDSDILLSKNYLFEHSLRLQMMPNAVFLSLKENISPNSIYTEDEMLNSGLPVSHNFNDKRLVRNAENDDQRPGRESEEGIFEILDETSLFKKFGYGRKINGCYDLVSCVIGHNMSMSRKVVDATGGFSECFSGWGLEDTYFGAKAIASGSFIIPVLSASVYHINHPARSGTEEQRMVECRKNEETYNKLIHEPKH